MMPLRTFRKCRECNDSIPKTEQLCYFQGKIVCKWCFKKLVGATRRRSYVGRGYEDFGGIRL